MAKIYFTLTGANHYYGTVGFEKGMNVKLIKEPKNEFDKEAIRVEMPGLGKVGYVANSVNTVMGDSYSAGRLYDCIGNTAEGKIYMIWGNCALCKLAKKSLLEK